MPPTNTLFPALRARMGDWWYYITTMRFSEIKDWVKKVDDIHEAKELKTWIQRKISDERLDQIADYLRNQNQHFFNSIVVGIYGGDPDWYPIKVGKNNAMPGINADEAAKHTFGFLSLDGSEEIFAIDGQHRVEGIKKAIQRHPSLATDQQAVIFVAHRLTERGRARTRRLFSTLNKFAKPVSDGEIVALSEDDTFAIVTRRMIDDYKPLNIHFVPLTKTANIPTNDNICITTVLALYDLIRVIALPPRSREKSALEIGPSNKIRTEEIYKISCEFWNHLITNVPEIKEVTSSQPDKHIALKHRHRDGGHVLFRPAGMKAFTQATRILIDRGNTMSDSVALLSRTQLQLTQPPWSGVLWNSVAKTMVNKNGKLAKNLFLYMAGQAVEPQAYDLLAEYRKALNHQQASLDGITVIA